MSAPPTPGCGRCDVLGRREIAHHFEASDGPDVYVTLGACPCERGRQLAATTRIVPINDLRDRWGSRPGTIRVVVDPAFEDRWPARCLRPTSAPERSPEVQEALDRILGRAKEAPAPKRDRWAEREPEQEGIPW